MIRTRDEALRILGPYLKRIERCIDRAWADLERMPTLIAAHMSPRSRACIVNDQTVLYAREEFQNDSGVAFLKGRGGLFLLGIAGAFLLRFKKLRSNLRSSNIHTQQSFAFVNQAEIPGLPDVTRINAGYILNRMQTAIANKYVTCPVGKTIRWDIDLADFAVRSNVASMPETFPQAAKPRTRVVPKNTKDTGTSRRTQQAGEEDGGDDDRNGKR